MEIDSRILKAEEELNEDFKRAEEVALKNTNKI